MNINPLTRDFVGEAFGMAGRCRKLAHSPTPIMEHATQPQFTHAHQWQVNELVMWDNRAMMRGV
jgi:hypothetical protein